MYSYTYAHADTQTIFKMDWISNKQHKVGIYLLSSLINSVTLLSVNVILNIVEF